MPNGANHIFSKAEQAEKKSAGGVASLKWVRVYVGMGETETQKNYKPNALQWS